MKIWNTTKLIVGLTAITLFIAACTDAEIQKVDKSASTNASTKPDTAPKIYVIGETVAFDKLEITINEAKESSGNEFDKPKDGKVYMVVDATVENKGDKETTVSSLMQLSMSDSDGYNYNPALTAFIKNQLDGTVGAGRKLRGQVAFEVPKDAKGLEFIFKDPFKKGQAIWKIK